MEVTSTRAKQRPIIGSYLMCEAEWRLAQYSRNSTGTAGSRHLSRDGCSSPDTNTVCTSCTHVSMATSSMMTSLSAASDVASVIGSLRRVQIFWTPREQDHFFNTSCVKNCITVHAHGNGVPSVRGKQAGPTTHIRNAPFWSLFRQKYGGVLTSCLETGRERTQQRLDHVRPGLVRMFHHHGDDRTRRCAHELTRHVFVGDMQQVQHLQWNTIEVWSCTS